MLYPSGLFEEKGCDVGETSVAEVAWTAVFGLEMGEGVRR